MGKTQKTRRKPNTKKAKEVKDYEEKDSKDARSKEYYNDASWYIPDESLRKQIGQFSFSCTLGVDSPLESVLDSGAYESTYNLGDIMSIGMFPWIGEPRNAMGIANDKNAICMSALKLYNKISSVNAKTTQYQPQNLAIAMLAIGDIISLVAYLQRAYGVAFQFNPRNRTIPRQLILAMGIDPDSLLDHLSEFRLKFNTILTRASNIRMLRDVKYFTKCWELYSHIFYDKNSSMGQYYVTRPVGYLELNEDAPELGALVFSHLGTPSNPKNIMTVLNYLNAIVDRVLESTTFNYIFTDIVNYVLKEGGEMLGFSYLPELYQVFPEFSETFMNQVHNMDWGMSDLSDYQIFDNVENNTITSTHIWKHTVDSELDALMYSDKILDFPYTDNPTVDEIIDACMYKIASTYTVINEGVAEPSYIAAPDHPVHDVYVINLIGSQTYPFNMKSNVFKVTDAGVPLDHLFYGVFSFDTFDVKPIQYAIDQRTGVSDRIQIFGNLNYWTLIKYQQLANMYQYAFLGLFDVEVKGLVPYK